MSDIVEHRVDTLESILGQFIVDTKAAFLRLERSQTNLHQEMQDFKDEMRTFKDEAESDRKRMNKQWGELANKMGTVVEDIVAPNIPRIAVEYFDVPGLETFAIRFHRQSSVDNSRVKEFDAVAASGTYFFVNYTRSTAKSQSVDDFVEGLAEIYDFFPEYQNRQLIPLFSSLSISEDVLKYLTRKKIYGMAMKDDTMDLLNFDDIN